MSSFKHVLEHSQQYGVEALSTAELFTLVLCGNSAANAKQREKALQAIQRLLAERNSTAAIVSTDVYELFAAEFDDKLAYRLVALLELNRRLTRPAEQRYQIRCPGDAARLVMPEMSHLKTEQMRILALDTKNQVVLNRVLYQGTANSAVFRVAEVYRPAVVRNCPAIIICHNHPSGDPTPSTEDIVGTEQIVQAGKLFEIELVDHLIIGNGTYTSLKEKLRW
ncbi:MAG TPA: DNA repair protein RadC [Ktedonobacteraceae bacterium]|nr:DNA repair protein RadC [Ktedonobacteraceae bacterium]